MLETEAAPEAPDVRSHAVVFVAQPEVDGELLGDLPVVQGVARPAVLAGIGQREALRGVGRSGRPEQERGEGTVGNVVSEVDVAARHVGGATEKHHAREVDAHLQVVGPVGDGEVIVELVLVVKVEAVAAVAVAQAGEVGHVDERQPGLARGESPVVVVDDPEARHAQGIEVEGAVGTGIEGIVH